MLVIFCTSWYRFTPDILRDRQIHTKPQSCSEKPVMISLSLLRMLAERTPNIQNNNRFCQSNTPIFIVLTYYTGNMFRLIKESSSGPYIQKYGSLVIVIVLWDPIHLHIVGECTLCLIGTC
jgi:hypothetical protein